VKELGGSGLAVGSGQGSHSVEYIKIS
jgi:hypothetical protein